MATEGYLVSKRLSAKYEGTFAYVTLKQRMPRILTQVIDTIHKEQERLYDQYGEAGREDVKGVIAQLSELRYQLQTNKSMVAIQVGSDVKEWGAVFETYREVLNGEEPSWFNVSWLFAECYMYRKMAEILMTSTYLKEFDPFGAQKEASFLGSLPQITNLASYYTGLISKPKQSLAELRVDFEHLLLLCLWGNKIDLSMMGSMEGYDARQDHLSSLDSSQENQQGLRTNVLADHSAALWRLMELVQKPSASSKRQVDFVLDNAGLEIFADICFADWLLSVGLADKIQFHCKQLPWFVSDALIKDFNWTLETLSSQENKTLSNLGQKWKARLKDGSFVVTDHSFWSTCYEYAAMESVAPELYQMLSMSHLVFFKGDLNYRKLLADRNWLHTGKFSMALGGFEPTNLCALRTLKADLVTGLPPGAAERAAKEDKYWMATGQYAVIQVHNSEK